MVKLTMGEKKRLEVIQMVMDGQIGAYEAGRVLGRTIRTIYRLLSRVRERGIEGIIHGNRGNQHARRYNDALKEKILKLVRGKYKDINDTHLVEILAREEKRLKIAQVKDGSGIGVAVIAAIASKK